MFVATVCCPDMIVFRKALFSIWPVALEPLLLFVGALPGKVADSSDNDGFNRLVEAFIAGLLEPVGNGANN